MPSYEFDKMESCQSEIYMVHQSKHSTNPSVNTANRVAILAANISQARPRPSRPPTLRDSVAICWLTGSQSLIAVLHSVAHSALQAVANWPASGDAEDVTAATTPSTLPRQLVIALYAAIDVVHWSWASENGAVTREKTTTIGNIGILL